MENDKVFASLKLLKPFVDKLSYKFQVTPLLSSIIESNFKGYIGIDDILEWNMAVINAGVLGVPLLLLTIRNGDMFESKNILLVQRPMTNNRLSWRVSWNDLSESERKAAFHFKQIEANNPFIKWDEKDVLIKDLLDPVFMTRTFEEKVFDKDTFPSMCFDALMVEDTNLTKYLQEKPEKRIVFFVAKKDGTFQAACTSRKILTNYITYFYQCTKETGYHPPSLLMDVMYAKILPFAEPYLITKKNLTVILSSKSQFFVIEQTPFILQYTISKKAYDTMNDARDAFVSADHCQKGSEKQLSLVYPIYSDNLEQAIEVVNKRQKT